MASRTKQDIRRYDLFKAFVLLILIIILLISIFTSSPQSSAGDSDMLQVSRNKPQNGAVFAPGPVEFSGSGNPNSSIVIVSNDRVLGGGVVNDMGKWYFQSDFEPGSYEIELQIVDENGATLGASDRFTIEVQQPIVVDIPEIDLSLNNDTPLTTGEFILSGKGTPGSDVEIFAGNNIVRTVRVDNQGFWSVPVTIDEPGEWSFQARSLNADGTLAGESPIVNFDFAPPTMPTKINSDSIVNTHQSQQQTLRGQGQPGAEVEIWVNGEPIGKTQIDNQGFWTFNFTPSTPGAYTIQANTLLQDQRVIEGTALEFQVEKELLSPELQSPDFTEDFAAGEITLAGTGEPGTSVAVVLDGQVIGTAQIDAEGKWSLPVTIPDEGSYPISLRALDADGSLFDETAPVTLDITSPARIFEITAPEDGIETEDNLIVLSGVGDPGTTIEVLEDGIAAGQSVVLADGTWSFTIEPLVGSHTYAIRPVGDQNQILHSIDITKLESEEVNDQDTEQAENQAAAATSVACKYGADQGKIWLVAGCDTLSRISQHTEIALAAILKANPDITNQNLIFPGQRINLPGR